ncbi:MAG TPA: penicillin-binding protein 1A [Candidatus Cybelea sp.]|nr:penicillin-binding protein 1A [Candidatus Cybelea sp.]
MSARRNTDQAPARSRSPRGRGNPRPKRPRGRLRRVAIWLSIVGIWALIGATGLIAYFAYDLPDLNRLYQTDRHPSVTLIDGNGATYATFGDLYGEFIPVDQMPKVVPEALLATEDRRFFHHFGIDPIGLARAVFADLRAGHLVQGGSTITQQLAKNVFLTPDRTLKRKVQEVLLALWLEHKFSKDQILSLYLNRVYFGAGTYGVDAASERYFSKSARDLALPEAAMLAGLLKAPTRYGPITNPTGARERASLVLDRMAAADFITTDQAKAAKAHPAVAIQPKVPLRNSRYFADWVLEGIDEYAGRGWSDLVVVTTLDMKLQADAERAVEGVLAKSGEARDVSQAALVALGPDGAVRAMVGGRDWRDSPFNRATQARRQPGSSFKLFVYLAGLEAGLSPESAAVDSPISVGHWSPKNDSNHYYGETTLREAFAHSMNSVAVQVAQQVGLETVIAMAHRLGITGELPEVPSVALGTGEVSLLELTGAYDVVANGGMGVIPYGIAEIRTRDGQVLFRRQGGGPGRVLPERVDRQMNELLTAVVESGTGHAAMLDRPAAGKTGTTQDFRDAWFVGYTSNLVAGVWVGNDDGEPMKRVSGGTIPVKIWHDFMAAGTAGQPVEALLAEAPGAAPGEESHRSIWQRILGQFGDSSPSRAPANAPTYQRRSFSKDRSDGIYHENTNPAPQVGPRNIF